MLIGGIILTLIAIVPLQRHIDATRDYGGNEEVLYLPSGNAVRHITLGFDGLIADMYWMRAIQYFGRKAGLGALREGSGERFLLLAPFLDIATTLDPQYRIAYEFGGMFIADYDDPNKAITLLEKGIRNNPDQWRLYQHLGFLFWKLKRYHEASEIYKKGSELPGAAEFMKVMSGVMLAEGGSRAVAKQMFTQIAEQSGDPRMREVMIGKLKLIRALDEIDFMHARLQELREKNGVMPISLAQLGALWRRAGIDTDDQGFPVDPDGFRFQYDPSTRAIAVASDSTLPKKF